MRKFAVLFDLDGTLLDTECQYSTFWESQCLKYHNDKDIALQIKGTTLKSIVTRYFSFDEKVTKQVLEDLYDFESKMTFPFVKGAERFIKELNDNDIPVAVVTSSDMNKMRNVFTAHPNFKDLFDVFLMAEDYTESKPSPECFLVAAERLGVMPQDCFVFEDSELGIEAGNRAGMTVVGLSTTLPVEFVSSRVKLCIPDFENINIEKLMSLK